MNKRKAIVCTLLLIIIMSALFIGSMFIENGDGSLYEAIRFIFFPFFCGYGANRLAGRFYDWLTKTDE